MQYQAIKITFDAGGMTSLKLEPNGTSVYWSVGDPTANNGISMSANPVMPMATGPTVSDLNITTSEISMNSSVGSGGGSNTVTLMLFMAADPGITSFYLENALPFPANITVTVGAGTPQKLGTGKQLFQWS